MKTKLFEQHREHSDWQSRLDFYKNEMKGMQDRLEEVSRKNNSTEVRKGIEHFQNQFIIQNRNVIEISEQIAGGEKKILAEIAGNPVASDHRSGEDHSKERDLVNSFETVFNQLRKEYNAFLANWL